jgi:hypothetical protein
LARLRPPALGQPPDESAESILDKERRIADIIVNINGPLLIFLVAYAPEGGFTARALGHSIFTEADSLEELRRNVRPPTLSLWRDKGWRSMPF